MYLVEIIKTQPGLRLIDAATGVDVQAIEGQLVAVEQDTRNFLIDKLGCAIEVDTSAREPDPPSILEEIEE